MAPITTWMHQKQCQDKFKNFSYIPDEEAATLDSQFFEYSKLLDNKRDGKTITLYRSDYWMRQAKILEDRKITMTNTDLKYCEAYFDSVICWKPTPAGNTTFENCPDVRLSDPTKLAFRTCGQSGLWLNRRQIESSVAGWTNYTPCFPANVKHLFDQVTDDDNAQIKSKALIQIARNTRILDIIGFSVSLIALVLSLFIFTRFRSLKNHRNRIHKSLFTAMILQYLLQQLLYIDQEFARSRPGDHFISTNSSIHVIENTPYVCEIFYVLLEYFISAMFIWMLIEGIYLNSLVSIAAFKYRVSYVIYYSVGWGVPFIITAVWAVITALHYQKEDVKKYELHEQLPTFIPHSIYNGIN
ncbi:unnamed protein product [Diatraea saccharalis]|uniref:PDF receptor n=1 Tax=Diatraea saccharalis TaxID=40085 RepID=A0A9N9QL19_9NEOP|nr:unnamed protein product [Diatraea saccharalis]